MTNDVKNYIAESFDIDIKALDLIDEAESGLKEVFSRIEDIAQFNQAKILKAFQDEKVAIRHFSQTTGYGYDDIGRDTLDKIFARAMNAEDALVRPQIASGTHALALMLSGLLLPGDSLILATGKPYDTLEEFIGISGSSKMSLKAYGIINEIIALKDGEIDIDAITHAIKDKTKVVYFQRSRGYEWREALCLNKLEAAFKAVKAIKEDIIIAVDNCYGEFMELKEPCEIGADLIAGSLIKNPGGGIAPTGGYIAGCHELIEQIAERMTSPGIGREVGSYAASYAPFYQGLFMAPHVVSQSVKGAALCARAFEAIGMKVLPDSQAERHDIIQSICFDDKDLLIEFCQSIQMASPVDSYALPMPWDMPGYQHQVIMAAGAFIQGSSIELSADAPIKPPYIAYMQGGLTYEHAKLGVAKALCAVMRKRK